MMSGKEAGGKELTDIEVVERVKLGDKKIFSILVRRHQKGLFRLCYRFLKDVSAAEDVVQEAFIKSYERLDSFESRSSFKSWLFQIAVNTAKNKLRERSFDTSDIEDVPLAVMGRAESDLVQNAVAQLLKKHIDDLPLKQRTALILRVYEDLSFKEIAEIMECPYDTAKANYRHALMRLKDELSAHQDLDKWSRDFDGIFMEMAKVAEVEL